MNPAPPKAVASPCVKVCVVDGDSGLCLGCLRTLPEIAAWAALLEEERTRIWSELPSRRVRIAPGLLGGT